MASISHASHLGKASSDVRGTHNGLAPLNRPDTESPRECDHDVVLVAPADARKDGELLDNDAGSKVDTPATARPSKSKDSPNPRLSATLPADETHLRPPQTTGTPASSSTVTSHRLTWSEWAIQYRTFLESAGKAIALFLFSLAVLALLLHLLLPPIDPKDRDAVKIPKNFDELQRLNTVLQIYKERNFARVLGSWVALYLFLQAYSLPGSMYLSILVGVYGLLASAALLSPRGQDALFTMLTWLIWFCEAGAMYGVLFALPLVCLCVASGATLCYLISALLGPALLLASEKWRDRLEQWRERIRQQGGNMISYLIVLRIAPLPPHWVVNVIAPHLDISIPLFWISTFFGVMAVSLIHVQIGTTLDQMTSADEFHLISWRNFLGLSGVVVGALIPVLLRRYWTQELADAVEDVTAAADEDGGGRGEGSSLAGQTARHASERSDRDGGALDNDNGNRKSNSVLVRMEEEEEAGGEDDVGEQARTHVSGDGAAPRGQAVWSPVSWWRRRQTGRIRL